MTGVQTCALPILSSRITGQYDYSAISKESAGDLYAWSWVRSPLCSPDSDLVFYLTSREGSFYSIWVLDLKRGTEERFCEEISPSIRGIGDQKLIAISDPDQAGATFGRLISTSDPEVFEAVNDNNWSAVNGWLFHDNDPGGVTLLKGQYELNVDLSEYSFQIQVVGTDIWIINDVLQNGPPEYIILDPISGSFSSARSAYEMTLKGWSDLLEDLNDNEVPIGETDRVTIG